MAKYVEIPLPNKGINEDAAPAALDENEALQMVNVLPHNKRQLERRGPYILADVDTNTSATMFPCGIAINGANALITYEDTAGSRYNITTGEAYRSGLLDPLAGLPGGQFTGRVWATTADGTPTSLNASSSTVAVTNYTNDIALTPDQNNLLPFSKPAYYEGVTYYTSIGTENTYTTLGSPASDTVGTRLVAWAGANKAAFSTTASITLGTTSLVFAGSQTGLVGTFVTFDADLTTASAQYAYRIISGSGTTWILEKPYGLGDTGAATRVAAACQVRSRDIPILSPVGAGVVCSHLDRVFVGRAKILASTGTLQPAYYANALKWSQALSPEKWPEANVTLIGSEPNDFIMGLATVGRYLLIFKRYSTWVMSGNSEENFSVQRLSGSIGCVDSRSIVEYEDSIIWASYHGIHMISTQLEVTDLTAPKPGHGIKRTYQATLTSFPVVIGYPAVTACVDNNDYLHVCSLGSHITVNGSLTGVSGSVYMRFPASCHIPTRSWTRLIGTSTVSSRINAASPRFLSAQNFLNRPFGMGHQSYLYLDLLTNPDAPVDTGVSGIVAGADYITDGAGSKTSTPFKIDVVSADLALAGYDTWQLSKLMVHHQVEYEGGSTDANVTGTIVLAKFDPDGGNGVGIYPTMQLGVFKARVLSSASLGHEIYIAEINPLSSSYEEAMRGMFLRLRISDSSVTPTDSWKLFRIVAVIDPGRPGRATDPLL